MSAQFIVYVAEMLCFEAKENVYVVGWYDSSSFDWPLSVRWNC